MLFLRITEKLSLQWILLSSFFVRLVVCIIYYFAFAPYELKPIQAGNYQGLGTDGYFQIARTLWLSGEYAFEVGGSPVHSRPPLQPFLLLLTSWSEQYWFWLWFIISSFLGTLAVYLTYQIAIKWSISSTKSLWIAFSVAFHPYLIIIARSTTFVHLGTVLLLSAFYIYWHSKENLLKYLLLGFICGLCLLTHGTFQILPVIFACFLLYKRKTVKAFFLLLFTLITVLPWTLRNYYTFGKPIFLVTGMGMQYWKGEESAFREKVDIYRKVYEQHTGKPLQIAYFCTINPDDDDLLWKLALNHIRENPLSSVQRFLYGIIIFLFPHETGLLKFIFTFLVNAPIYLAICFRQQKRPLYFWQKEIIFYMLWVIMAFAFFTPHAGYIVMFLPILVVLMA